MVIFGDAKLNDKCGKLMKDTKHMAVSYVQHVSMLNVFFLMHPMQCCKSCLNSIKVLMSNVKNASKNRKSNSNC